MTHDSIKSHAVQFQTLEDIKDSSKVALLTKLSASIDVLSWMDEFEKHLRKVTGINHFPPVYLLREDLIVPVTTENLLPGKCYSEFHGSLCEEFVFRKSHLSLCVEIDKVALYGLLYPVLKSGPLELALLPHEKTKDDMRVIKEMYTPHSRTQKWEKAHATQTACLSNP